MLLNIAINPISEDNLNRFYTRYAIGELLVSQLNDIYPLSILDLGAGEGTLSTATARKWKDAEVVTVDIDSTSSDKLHTNIIKTGAKKHSHYIQNVLNPRLPTFLPRDNLFDLAVCNPPFYKPEWHPDFSYILHQADLEDACPSKADVTGEVLFLAQNLRLIKNGGVIALIAPDGMLTSWRTTQLRRTLMEKHRIDCVLQLPRHSFHDTEARCFILILTKGTKTTDQVKLLKYEASGEISEPIFITTNEAEKRLDYDFHIGHVHNENHTYTTLRELGAEIKRGSMSTVEAKNSNFPIFHTTDYVEGNLGRLTLNSELTESPKLVVAQPGDILMARVDRSLHQKIAIVISGSAAVTDCVYRVRLPKKFQEVAFQALNSVEGKLKIKAATKGVSARLLGKADLLDLPLVIKP
jgi:type I restriction enzyme M protein